MAAPSKPEPLASLDRLVERLRMYAYVVDKQDRVSSLNAALSQRLGQTVADGTPLATFASLLYPDPAARENAVLSHQRVLAGAPKRDAEWVIACADGEQRHVHWHFLLLGEGPSALLLVAGEDVTDRRRIEHWTRLQTSILEHVRTGIVVTDREGRILHWTGEAESLLGTSMKAVHGRPLHSVLEGPERRVMGLLNDAVERGEFEISLTFRGSNGPVPCDARVFRVLSERGQTIGMAIHFEPVGRHISATTTPAPPQATAPGASAPVPVDSPLVAIVIADLDGKIRRFGEGAATLSNTAADAAVGRQLLDDVFRIDGLTWAAAAERLTAGPIRQLGVLVVGEWRRSIELTLAVMPDAPDTVVLTVVDRSALVDRDRRLSRAGADAALGRVGLGLAAALARPLSVLGADEHHTRALLEDARALGRLLEAGAEAGPLRLQYQRSSLAGPAGGFDELLERQVAAHRRLRKLVEHLDALQLDGAAAAPARLGELLSTARDLVGSAVPGVQFLTEAPEELPWLMVDRPRLLRGLVLLLLAQAGGMVPAPAAGPVEVKLVVLVGADGEPLRLVTEAKIVEIERRRGRGATPPAEHDGLADVERAARSASAGQGTASGGRGTASTGKGASSEAAAGADAATPVPDAVLLVPGEKAPQVSREPAENYDAGPARDLLRSGGFVWSELRRGLVREVTLELPVRRARPVEVSAPPPARRGSVLIVEEDPELQRALDGVLTDQHGVVAVGSFADAIVRYKALASSGGPAAPDATVIGFPSLESRGFEFMLQGVEAFPASSRNTIVLLPTSVRSTVRERLIRMGWLVIRQPVDPYALRSMLVRLTPDPR